MPSTAAQTKAYRAANPEKASQFYRNADMKRLYGITLTDYHEMYAAQDGVCKLCHMPESATGRTGKVLWLAVDHNHETGLVRGLLCRDCNWMVGRIEADVARACAIINYLQQ